MVAAASVCMATSASAALIQWNVTGTFASGATASGTVVWNTATNAFDSWSIDLTGDSTLSATTYSNTVPGSMQFNNNSSVSVQGSTAGFGSLAFFASSGLFARLADALTPITFHDIDECRPNCGVRRSGTVASFTNGTDVTPPPVNPPPVGVVPLPASLPLLLAALGMVGILSARRSRAA